MMITFACSMISCNQPAISTRHFASVLSFIFHHLIAFVKNAEDSSFTREWFPSWWKHVISNSCSEEQLFRVQYLREIFTEKMFQSTHSSARYCFALIENVSIFHAKSRKQHKISRFRRHGTGLREKAFDRGNR